MDDPTSSKRGILKASKPNEGASRQKLDSHKAARFDEKNVRKTYQPANKTYGLMKIEEPKTPYPSRSGSHPVNPDELRRRLETLRNSERSSSEESLQEQQRQRREQFEKRRRLSHHNEFKLAKEMNEKFEDNV